MQRLNLILIVILAVAGAGFAQSSGSAPMAPPAGSAVGGTTNTGTVVDGTVVTTAPQGAVSPEIHLETVMPPAGATSNMPGAPAGISSSPSNAGTVSAPNTYTVSVEKNAPQPMRDPNAANAATVNPGGSTAIQDTHGMIYAGAVYTASTGIGIRSAFGAKFIGADIERTHGEPRFVGQLITNGRRTKRGRQGINKFMT